MPPYMDTITTTFKREWLRGIAAGRKRVEYRKPVFKGAHRKWEVLARYMYGIGD